MRPTRPCRASRSRRCTRLREIADAAFRLQSEIDRGERVVVGVNRFTEGDDEQTPIWRIDPALERKQIDRVQAVRAARDSAAVEQALAALAGAAASERENLMGHLLHAARVRATEGEIIDRLQEVWGAYTETPVY